MSTSDYFLKWILSIAPEQWGEFEEKVATVNISVFRSFLKKE